MESAYTYCYICAKEIRSTRSSLFLDDVETAYKSQHIANPDFPRHSDPVPVTCYDADCMRAYKQLPSTGYSLQLARYDPTARKKTSYEPPFLDFPSKRRDLGIQWEKRGIVSIDNYLLSVTPKKLEPLFQEWLFFGLIQEFLGERFNRKQYVDENWYLTVNRLEKELDGWKMAIYRRRPSTRMFDHWLECIWTVNSCLNMIMTPCSEGRFNSSLEVSISAAAELLNAALSYMFPQNVNPVGFAHLSFAGRSSVDCLVERGWCRYDAASMLLLASPCNYALRKDIFRPHLPGNHAQCSEKVCRSVMNPEDGISRSKHRRTDCICDEMSLNEEQMNKLCGILRKNQIPLLELRADEEGRVDSLNIINSIDRTNHRYIAISHVWSQGLGNSFSNGLRRCQLDYLFSCARTLFNVPHSHGPGKSMYIWIDTICCPLASFDQHEVLTERFGRMLRSPRQNAIALMRQTYKDAARVLVLDTELEQIEVNKMSVLEIAAIVVESQWTKRLWTLQEAALPPELWIQFRDRPLCFYTLYLALRDKQRYGTVSVQANAAELLRRLISMRNVVRMRNVSPARNAKLLRSALRWRLTTKPTDESLCIATLLDLDLNELLLVQDGERMRKLYDMLSRSNLIGKSALFTTGSKLIDRGYRWAPDTFLGSNAFGVGGLFEGSKLFSDSSGLRLESAGHLFSICETAGVPDLGLLDARLRQKDFILLRNLEGQWIKMSSCKLLQDASYGISVAGQDAFYDERMRDWSGRFALILKDEGCETSAEQSTALVLDEILVTENGTIECTPKRLVMIVYQNDTSNKIFDFLIHVMHDLQLASGYQILVEKAADSIGAAKERAKADLQRCIRDRIMRQLSRSEDLRNTIKLTMKENKHNFGTKSELEQICHCVYAILGALSQYAVVTEKLSETQRWVVT